MRSFKDNEGRQWSVDINVAAIKRVRGLTGTDLMQVIEGTLIEKLICDPVLLCDVVYAICKPEADTRNVSDEEFGKAMAGDAIEPRPRRCWRSSWVSARARGTGPTSGGCSRPRGR